MINLALPCPENCEKGFSRINSRKLVRPLKTLNAMFSFWRSCCKQLDDNPKIYLIPCKHCFQQAFREIIVGILRIVTCREFQFNLEMKFYSKRCIILQVFIHLTYNVFYYKSVIVCTL